MFIVVAASRPVAAATPVTVLYAGALGTLPEAQGLAFEALPAFGNCASATLLAAAVQLTTSNICSAGYSNWDISSPLTPQVKTPLTLERATGYRVILAAQVVTETHTNSNRAGFSLIAVGHDLQGIELGFWMDSVWAQSGPAFTQAESVSFTTTSLMTYTLDITGTGYTLAVNSAPILTGPLRDYSASSLPAYTTPDFIFVGDDTTSASANVQLAYVAVAVAGKPFSVYLPVMGRP